MSNTYKEDEIEYIPTMEDNIAVSKVLAFDWAASRICIRFTGTSCKLRLNGGGAFFAVLLRTMQSDYDECR